MLENVGNGLVEGQLTSVDLEVKIWRSFVGVADTGEVGDLTGTGLLVETLDVAGFADLEGGADVALIELESGVTVDLLGLVAVLSVGGNEGDEDDDSGHVEEL